MKKATIIALLLLVVSNASAQSPQYFPNLAFETDQQHNEFTVRWYSKHLKALQEPSLLEQSKTPTNQAYRFLWLRSFHHPVAVRLNVKRNGTSSLTVKITDGQGGYEPGKLIKNDTRTLTKQETEWFLDRVQEFQYWNLPTREPETREPETDVLRVDGAQWVLEATKAGNYKVVDRWSPEKGPVHSLGMMMLIDLAKLKLLYQDVY